MSFLIAFIKEICGVFKKINYKIKTLFGQSICPGCVSLYLSAAFKKPSFYSLLCGHPLLSTSTSVMCIKSSLLILGKGMKISLAKSALGKDWVGVSKQLWPFSISLTSEDEFTILTQPSPWWSTARSTHTLVFFLVHGNISNPHMHTWMGLWGRGLKVAAVLEAVQRGTSGWPWRRLQPIFYRWGFYFLKVQSLNLLIESHML